MRVSCVACLFAGALAGFGATRALPIGDPERGYDLFQTRKCITCHNIAGEGGKTAPDLARQVDRAFNPYVLAGLMWNHAPSMWAALERAGMPRPELSAQDAADLFVYLFSAGALESPPDDGRGREVYQAKKCGACHNSGSALLANSTPARGRLAVEDRAELAQRSWNRSGEMRAALEKASIAYPQLTAIEFADLAAFLRTVAGPPLPGSVAPAPEPSKSGGSLYAQKGCARCHRGALNQEGRPTRFNVNEFAAAMWNHPFRTRRDGARLGSDEMRSLVNYLVSIQFTKESGNPDRGEKVFAGKGCSRCHDSPSSGAPPRSSMAGRMTSYVVVAALWRHGPEMVRRIRQSNTSWPRFRDAEMADVAAYLHRLEFKRRRTLKGP